MEHCRLSAPTPAQRLWERLRQSISKELIRKWRRFHHQKRQNNSTTSAVTVKKFFARPKSFRTVVLRQRQSLFRTVVLRLFRTVIYCFLDRIRCGATTPDYGSCRGCTMRIPQLVCRHIESKIMCRQPCRAAYGRHPADWEGRFAAWEIFGKEV